MEVGAEGADGVALHAGPIKRIVLAEVEIRGGRGVDGLGGEGAAESDACVAAQVTGLVARGRVDGHAGEHGIGDGWVGRVLVPLNKIRCAGHEVAFVGVIVKDCGEVQRQRAVVECAGGLVEGHHRYTVPTYRRIVCAQVIVERQAQRVPFAVPVEGAAFQRHVELATVIGSCGNDSSIVTVVGKVKRSVIGKGDFVDVCPLRRGRQRDGYVTCDIREIYGAECPLAGGGELRGISRSTCHGYIQRTIVTAVLLKIECQRTSAGELDVASGH